MDDSLKISTLQPSQFQQTGYRSEIADGNRLEEELKASVNILQEEREKIMKEQKKLRTNRNLTFVDKSDIRERSSSTLRTIDNLIQNKQEQLSQFYESQMQSVSIRSARGTAHQSNQYSKESTLHLQSESSLKHKESPKQEEEVLPPEEIFKSKISPKNHLQSSDFNNPVTSTPSFDNKLQSNFSLG